MKNDINDTLRNEGPEGVRARHDRAHKERQQKKANGEGKTAADQAVGSPRFTLTPFEEIRMCTKPNYLIKGVIPQGGLIVVWGAPKCGKSFLCFDMAMHIALGRPYRDRRVIKGAVVYLALEGGGGFARRVEAWRQYHAIGNEPVPFHLLAESVDLIGDHRKLIEVIRQSAVSPAVIFIDTLNRALVGDENKPDDMARFIRAADALRAAFGCAVVIIHHCGVAASRPRGHTSLSGADDAQIAVERAENGLISATVEHMKDSLPGAPFASRLQGVELGNDDDGDPITSCVVVPATSASTSASIRVTASQRRFLDILAEAILDAPFEHKSTENGQIAISREWVKMCCKSKGWFDAQATENNNRAKVSNTLNALAGRHLIGLSNLYVWLAK